MVTTWRADWHFKTWRLDRPQIMEVLSNQHTKTRFAHNEKLFQRSHKKLDLTGIFGIFVLKKGFFILANFFFNTTSV